MSNKKHFIVLRSRCSRRKVWSRFQGKCVRRFWRNPKQLCYCCGNIQNKLSMFSHDLYQHILLHICSMYYIYVLSFLCWRIRCKADTFQTPFFQLLLPFVFLQLLLSRHSLPPDWPQEPWAKFGWYVIAFPRHTSTRAANNSYWNFFTLISKASRCCAHTGNQLYLDRIFRWRGSCCSPAPGPANSKPGLLKLRNSALALL